MYHKIVVWCKEAEQLHTDPEKKVQRTRPPCVRNWAQTPPCQDKPCDPMKNYLRDHAY